MNNTKFTMNALLVIVTVFSAIGLFFTVGIYDMGRHVYLISDYQEIEGVRYHMDEREIIADIMKDIGTVL